MKFNLFYFIELEIVFFTFQFKIKVIFNFHNGYYFHFKYFNNFDLNLISLFIELKFNFNFKYFISFIIHFLLIIIYIKNLLNPIIQTLHEILNML